MIFVRTVVFHAPPWCHSGPRRSPMRHLHLLPTPPSCSRLNEDPTHVTFSICLCSGKFLTTTYYAFIQHPKKHNNQPYRLKPTYVWGILLRAEALGCTTALLISLKRSGYLEITGFSLCTNSYVELYVATIFLPFPSDFEDQNGDQQGISNKRQSHG